MAGIGLYARGFVLTLTPENRAPDSHFYGWVTLISPAAPTIRGFASFPVSDLARLRDWIEAHISRLVEDQPQSLESPVWVPLDLSLSVRCLSGEGSHGEEGFEGSFGVQVFIAVGRDLATRSNIYAGLEGVIGMRDALAFCQEIAAYIDRSTPLA